MTGAHNVSQLQIPPAPLNLHFGLIFTWSEVSTGRKCYPTAAAARQKMQLKKNNFLICSSHLICERLIRQDFGFKKVMRL